MNQSIAARSFSKGDIIDLVLDANGSHANDSTYLDITVRCPAYITE